MKEFKLNLCCTYGDPLDARTWSGTALNICTELEKSGSLGNAFNSSFTSGSKLIPFILGAASKIYYNNSQDVARGAFHRYYRSQKVKNICKKDSHTLHLGTLDLPFFSKPKDQKHYLYVDSTWDLWSRHATTMTNYTPKMLKESARLETLGYNQVTHIFSISEYVKTNLIEHYKIAPEKITVVGTGRGILEPYFGKKDYLNGKILFTAKRRFKDKGGDLVLGAFQKALQKNPDLQLTIVGQDEYTSKIDVPNVSTLGFITLEELQKLFNESSVFIMPALNEPWGLVYIEALACKTPIIGLKRNSFPEISGYGKYGYMIDSSSDEDLANLLLAATSNPAELEEKGLAGQRFCLDTFSWDKVVNTITETITNKYL